MGKQTLFWRPHGRIWRWFRLPPSINVNLGTQRSFQHDTVTSFLAYLFGEGLYNCPQHNPLHPCNLQNAWRIWKQTGKAYHEWIMACESRGIPRGGITLPLTMATKLLTTKWGRLFGLFPFRDTVYDAYRRTFQVEIPWWWFKPRSGRGRFWSRTNEIFSPSFQAIRQN